MISKMIATASTPEAAIRRMERALGEYQVIGIKTTIPLHRAIMQNADFRKGQYSTGFLEKFLKDGVPVVKE
jgi:acetyl-CoA carboxylase biotin carboxylase subunit